MKEELYVEILDETLLPFLHDKFGDSNYRFMQDNDVSHELGCKRMRWTGGRHHPSLPTLTL